MKHDPLFEISQANQEELAEEWSLTSNVFRAFHGLPAGQRFQHLGLLFEKLVPWLERSIRMVVLRHFLVLPRETLVARLFARAARLKRLPETYEAFLLWVEAMILQDLADPEKQPHLLGGAQGEPSPELQQRFNGLPMSERALLYLFMVEGLSLSDLSERTGIPVRTALKALKRGWQKMTSGAPDIQVPRGWQTPGDSYFGRRRRSGD